MSLALVLYFGGPQPTLAQTSAAGERAHGDLVRGRLLARRFTTVSSEIAAKISTLAVQDGDRFRTGDPLLLLDCAVQHAQHDEVAAALRAATATRQVNQRLHQLNSAGELEVELALAEEAKARARLSAAKAILSKCRIDAPFDGKVADLKVQALQYVQPGQPLLDLVDDTGFEVELIAPSRWLSWLVTGQVFQIAIDETARSYAAKVLRIGGRIDSVSETIKVYGEILKPAPELVPGMSGAVKFP